MNQNADLRTSFVHDVESEPPGLVASAGRWMSVLRWASSALIVTGGMHIGILLARGGDRISVPAHWLWVWPPALIGGLAWLSWLVCLLGVLRPMHMLQQIESPRPLRWPYWLLPVSLVIPPIGVPLLGWYLHAIFRATPIRRTAPFLHLGFWSISVLKIVLIVCFITLGAGMAWQFNTGGTAERWRSMMQPLSILDRVTAILGIALCFWILVRVQRIFAGRFPEAVR